MTEQIWSVEIDVEVEVGDGQEAEDRIERLLEVLADRSPALSYGPRLLSARFSVTERRAKDAIWRGLDVLSDSLEKAGFTPPGDAIRMEAESYEDLEQRLAVSDMHELVGVAELAEFLGVSRQRASELANAREFPAPVTRLASGPLWRKSAVARFQNRWPRHPGRPVRELTEQEAQILDRAMRGESLADLAADLGITEAAGRRRLIGIIERALRTDPELVDAIRVEVVDDEPAPTDMVAWLRDAMEAAKEHVSIQRDRRGTARG
jgi:transcriptional regulator with XRE-family HTH domain